MQGLGPFRALPDPSTPNPKPKLHDPLAKATVTQAEKESEEDMQWTYSEA